MQCKAATYILRRRITFLRIWIMVVLRIPLCIIVRRMDRYEPTLSVAALWCMSRKGGMLQVDLIVVKAHQHTHQLLFWVFWLLNIIGKSRNNTKQTADCQSFWFPQCFATGKKRVSQPTLSMFTCLSVLWFQGKWHFPYLVVLSIVAWMLASFTPLSLSLFPFFSIPFSFTFFVPLLLLPLSIPERLWSWLVSWMHTCVSASK